MNTIQIGNEKIDNNTLIIDKDEDYNIIYDNINISLKIIIKSACKIYEYINNSKIDNTYDILDNTNITRFSINSTVKTSLNINKDNIEVKYALSTINIEDNNYIVNINQTHKNTKTNIYNYGINYSSSKLDFLINSKISKDAINAITNQDSKIILMKDNNCLIKPNLLIDCNDVDAKHSSYIGSFDKEKIFYLESRGLLESDCIKILAKAFLIEHLEFNDYFKEKISEKINEYWR